MPYALLPTLLLQILLIGYSPGPANIYALAMSLRHSRRKALVMWLGLLMGFSMAVCIMAVMTHLIGMAFGNYVGYLKYLGAAYIAYLAYKIYTSRRSTADSDKDCTFVSGMVVQLTNAKILLFDLTAFSTFVLPYSNRLIDLLEVGAWLLIAGPGANLVWLLAGSYLKKFFAQYGRQVDVVSAIALLLCAIYIIIG
ncbi:MAG: LysE family transporter [Bacteroidales bacterium]|nr:LysE family transporter [Bacteroidales bacterium]